MSSDEPRSTFQPRPPADKCRTALKILTAFERLANDRHKRIPPRILLELRRKREEGTLTIDDLPDGSSLANGPAGNSMEGRLTKCVGCVGSVADHIVGVGTMGIYPEFDNLTLDALVTQLRGAAPDGPGYAEAYYLEVADRVAQCGRDGIEALQAALPSADAKRSRAILYGLTVPTPEVAGLRDLLAAHLNDRRSLVVAEAVDGFAKLGATEFSDRVIALQKHSSPCVRSAVLRYLRRLMPQIARPMLVRALNDHHHAVRSSAIDELDALGDTEFLPLLRSMVADTHPHVREAACMAVENLECLVDAHAATAD